MMAQFFEWELGPKNHRTRIQRPTTHDFDILMAKISSLEFDD